MPRRTPVQTDDQRHCCGGGDRGAMSVDERVILLERGAAAAAKGDEAVDEEQRAAGAAVLGKARRGRRDRRGGDLRRGQDARLRGHRRPRRKDRQRRAEVGGLQRKKWERRHVQHDEGVVQHNARLDQGRPRGHEREKVSVRGHPQRAALEGRAAGATPNVSQNARRMRRGSADRPRQGAWCTARCRVFCPPFYPPAPLRARAWSVRSYRILDGKWTSDQSDGERARARPPSVAHVPRARTARAWA